MNNSQGSTGDASDMHLGALRRVVPIARTVIRGGLALTLLSFDEFEDEFAFRCRLVAREDHPIRAHSFETRREEHAYAEALVAKRRQDGAHRGVAPMVLHQGPLPKIRDGHWPEFDWIVGDDRGNRYRPRGFGGGEHGPGEFRLEYTFEPALDPNASTLVIQVSRIDWTSIPPREKDRAPVRSEAGPWVFRVALSAGVFVIESGGHPW
jgi:hypothetical protein